MDAEARKLTFMLVNEDTLKIHTDLKEFEETIAIALTEARNEALRESVGVLNTHDKIPYIQYDDYDIDSFVSDVSSAILGRVGK